VGSGFLAGWWLRRRQGKKALGEAKARADRILQDGRREAEKATKAAVLQAKEEWYRARSRLERDIRNRQRQSQKMQRTVDERENRVQSQMDQLRRKEQSLRDRDRHLAGGEKRIQETREQVERLRQEYLERVEKVSGLTVEEAKRSLINALRNETRFEAAGMIKEVKEESQRNATRETQRILSLAIERVASEYTAEKAVTTVAIPSEKIKGRIIGQDGKNIKAFEKITGMQLLMDESPDTVVLSGFHPIKREIARLTLERLVKDGNIHPKRIEELAEKSRKKVEQAMQRAADDALNGLGIKGVNPELVKILGRLKFRTSYGQNVLEHSIEVAKLTSLMASELGMDGALAKRAGLFHDIGKAIDYEREGSHPEIGEEVARKYNEPEVVVNAVASHHEDAEVISPISVLVGAADAISGSRPGARRKSIAEYVKRIGKLEAVADSVPGVDHSYAIQAGREVRVIAKPNKIDDASLSLLASDIAKKIQSEMDYPGKIKVTVIREMRVTSHAR
jgi:ribonuclease Y